MNFGAYLANNDKEESFEEEKFKDPNLASQKKKLYWTKKQWESLMASAFEQAKAAAHRGEVPVGAALMDMEGNLLAADGNRVVEQDNPLAHAEMLVLEAVRQKYGSAFLRHTALAVTLEPCPLCAAAIGALKIKSLSFGAYDQKGGAVDHGPRLFSLNLPYPPLEIFGGIRERESTAMLKKFFERLRDRPDSVSV